MRLFVALTIPDAVAAPLAAPADQQWLAQDAAHPHPRIERGKRILEHELNLASNTGLSSPALGQKILPLEPDFSSVGLLQAYQAHGQGRLPATGFTD